MGDVINKQNNLFHIKKHGNSVFPHLPQMWVVYESPYLFQVRLCVYGMVMPMRVFPSGRAEFFGSIFPHLMNSRGMYRKSNI